MNGTGAFFDDWSACALGLNSGYGAEDVRAAQLRLLSGQALYAMRSSRFYRELYAGLDTGSPLSLPLISERELIDSGSAMVCVPQSEIRRIVSMCTSGSTGSPKRIYFTRGDLERTVDFFAVGMTLMTRPGDRVLICLGGKTPDGLGDLLSRGLIRAGREPVFPPVEPDGAVCIVGAPDETLSLAKMRPELRPRSVLLSSDNISAGLRLELGAIWKTEVFTHWGMRETGLGGAVECSAHDGCHIRHSELFIEIIDPDSAEPVPFGETGELVISTLRREAMPLIRYRTGDAARLITKPCRCGGVLPRLYDIRGHVYTRR